MAKLDKLELEEGGAGAPEGEVPEQGPKIGKVRSSREVQKALEEAQALEAVVVQATSTPAPRVVSKGLGNLLSRFRGEEAQAELVVEGEPLHQDPPYPEKLEKEEERFLPTPPVITIQAEPGDALEVKQPEIVDLYESLKRSVEAKKTVDPPNPVKFEPKPLEPIKVMEPEKPLEEDFPLLDAAPDPDTPPFPSALFSIINGQAGTGKTFLLRGRPTNEELVATTGIAAINLGGATINSLLGYFDTADLKDKYIQGYLQARLRGLAEQGTRRINLDEVSMLSGEALDILVDAFIQTNEDLQQKGRRPLGLTLCGDFAQLPPIKAPFAFEADHWGLFKDNKLTLTKIRRQADRDFIEALQAVRGGNSRRALEFFGGRFVSQLDDQFDGSTIKSKNDEVDRYNHIQLRACKGEPLEFQNKKEGVQRGEWKHIPEGLELKVGALVMILANRRTEGMPPGCYDYVNGDLGHILQKVGEGTGAKAKVKLVRDGTEPWVDYVARYIHEGTGKDAKVNGSVEYMPIRLAYATTCHKSQGLSLYKVQVDIRGHFFQSPGMLYVALSRARTADGLRLVGNEKMFQARCTVNKKVIPWL